MPRAQKKSIRKLHRRWLIEVLPTIRRNLKRNRMKTVCIKMQWIPPRRNQSPYKSRTHHKTPSHQRKMITSWKMIRKNFSSNNSSNSIISGAATIWICSRPQNKEAYSSSKKASSTKLKASTNHQEPFMREILPAAPGKKWRSWNNTSKSLPSN